MSKAKSINDYNSPFATRLREIMDNNPNITQQQVADYLGVTRQSISQYMNGNSQATADKIILLTQFFNVSADYLLGITDIKTADTSVQSVSHYLGVNDKIVIGIKNNIDMLLSDVDEHKEFGINESEMLDVFEKIVNYDDYLLEHIIRNILSIVENNDLNFYVNTAAFNSYKYARHEQLSVKSEKDINEFLIYKTFTDYFIQIAKNYGSSFSNDDIQRINSAKDYKELLQQMMTYKSDRLNSLLWRRYASRFIELSDTKDENNG